MRHRVALLLMMAAFAASSVSATEITNDIKECSVRIKAWREEARPDGNVVISDHGTGSSVNLSEFGMDGPGYILTAYHVVYSNSEVLNIEVETSVGWIRADIIYFDEAYDLCLLKLRVPAAIPKGIHLAPENATVGEDLLVMGSPMGAPIRPTRGKHLGINERGMASGSMTIDHGDSGSPVFDSRGRIIGVVHGGEAAAEGSSDIAPGKTLYRPLHMLRRFIASSVALEGKKWGSGSAIQK